MAVQFTKTMIIVLVLCNMCTIKADLGNTMVKKPQLISSVRQHQESLTNHQRFGVTNNTTTMNQKLWLNMKHMLAQLKRKQMNQQTKLSDLFLLRDAIKTKKLQQELKENSDKNEATSVRKTYAKNQGIIMKNISHIEISGSVNGSKVFPTDINIPKANSHQLNVYLKFLDRMIKNRINLLKKVTNNMTTESASVDEKAEIRNKVIHDSPPNMMAESAIVDEKAEIRNKVTSHPNMVVQTATVDENAEKAEILKFMSRNSVNATIQSTPLDEDSEKVEILKLISRHQKTGNGDVTQELFGDLEKPNNVELSTRKNIDKLNREVVITTIQTYQNDGILNQNTSQDNEITHWNLNIPNEIIEPRNVTVEQFILSGNLTKLESHVSNEIMTDELLTRRRQKSDPHRHPTERDLSKHSLEKGLPIPNKGNSRLRDREGHSSKFRQLYADDVDANEYAEDTLDALSDPLGIGGEWNGTDEPIQTPQQYNNSGMGLLEILILIMICIIATQCCILGLLYFLRDKLIVNLTFKYGQIKV